MTSKKIIWSYIKEALKTKAYFQKNNRDEREIDKQLKELQQVYEDLKAFDELKEPHYNYESEDGNYLVIREAFWGYAYEEKLAFGYSVCKWSGEYEEIPINKTLKIKPPKTKKWDEILHYVSYKKQDGKDVLETTLNMSKVVDKHLEKGKDNEQYN